MIKLVKSGLNGLKMLVKRIINSIARYMPSSAGSTFMRERIKAAFTRGLGAIDPKIFVMVKSLVNGAFIQETWEVDRHSFSSKGYKVEIDETGEFYIIAAKHGPTRYRIEDVRSIVFFRASPKPAPKKPSRPHY